MKDRTRLVFFSRWLTSPMRVASVMPSSAPLARAMASALPDGDGLVVELGGGTGPVTQALLEAGVVAGDLAVVEHDAYFCRYLSQRFPEITVCQGDALDLVSLLERQGIDEPVRAVVSGLPLLSMNSRTQSRLLQQAMQLTGGVGPLIQFSYSPVSPLRRTVEQRLGVVSQCVAQVWLNVPPAKVWSYNHPVVPSLNFRQQPEQAARP